MSKLTRDIRRSTKQSGRVPAVVVDVFYGRASVKLAGNGMIMRNLSVIGGPVVAGDVVGVDFMTPEPTVVAQSQEGLTLADVLALLDDELSKSGAFVWQILTFAQGTVINSYPSDASGLADAFTDTGDGGTVMIPPTDFGGDFTCQDGCSIIGISQRNTRILGSLTMGGGSITNMTVVNAGSSSSQIEALIVDATQDETEIWGCRFYCENAGSGDAVGVDFVGAKKGWIYSSYLEGKATGAGNGYGIGLHGNLADVWMEGGHLIGSTHPYVRVV